MPAISEPRNYRAQTVSDCGTRMHIYEGETSAMRSDNGWSLRRTFADRRVAPAKRINARCQYSSLEILEKRLGRRGENNDERMLQTGLHLSTPAASALPHLLRPVTKR